MVRILDRVLRNSQLLQDDADIYRRQLAGFDDSGSAVDVDLHVRSLASDGVHPLLGEFLVAGMENEPLCM